MRNTLSKASLFSVAAVALLVSGCASTDDIRKAQATADQALSTAQEAKQMAADAQAAAHAAQQSVDQLKSEESTTTTTTSGHGGQRG